MLANRNKEKSNQGEYFFPRASVLSPTPFLSDSHTVAISSAITTYLGAGLLRLIHSPRRLTSGSVSLRQGDNTAGGAKSVGRGAKGD